MSDCKESQDVDGLELYARATLTGKVVCTWEIDRAWIQSMVIDGIELFDLGPIFDGRRVRLTIETIEED